MFQPDTLCSQGTVKPLRQTNAKHRVRLVGLLDLKHRTKRKTKIKSKSDMYKHKEVSSQNTKNSKNSYIYILYIHRQREGHKISGKNSKWPWNTQQQSIKPEAHWNKQQIRYTKAIQEPEEKVKSSVTYDNTVEG